MARSEPIRVLCMEDDPAQARILQSRLERAGYAVDLTYDGETGLEVYDAQRHHVVVVDHAMPACTGLEVIRRLARRGPLPPLIMVTGQGNEHIAVQALKMGADDYVVKDVGGAYLDLLPKVIEQALQRARAVEEQRMLLDTVPTQIWYLTDPETYGSVNAAHAQFLGKERAGLEGRSLFDIAGPDEARICIAGNQEVFQTARPIRTEEWVVNGAGEPRLLSITKTPRMNQTGAVDYVVCAAEDVTDQRRAEHLLQVQHACAAALSDAADLPQGLQALLDTLLDSAIVDVGGIYLVDRQTGALELAAHRGLSPEFVESATAFGPDAPQTRLVMAGKPVYASHTDILESAQVPVRRDEGLRAMAIIPIRHGGETIAALNLASRTADRISPWTRGALETIASQVGSAIARLRHTREHRLARAALERSERRLRELFDASPIAIELYDAAGELVDANAACLELFGVAAREHVLGFDLFADPNLPEEARHSLRRGDSVRFEAPLDFDVVCERGLYETSKSGVAYLDVQITPLGATREAQPEGYLVQIQDVTERTRAQQDLSRRLKQVTALVEAARAVTESLELQEVLQTIVRLAQDIAGADDAGLVLLDETGGIDQAVEGPRVAPSLKYRIRDRGFTRWIVDTHQPILVDDVGPDGVMDLNRGEDAPASVNPHLARAGFRSVAGLPLMAKDRVLGVLYLHSRRVGAFRSQESILTAFASQVASAVENARLFEQVTREIAERARVEQALRESEERYRTLVAHQGEGMATADVDDVFTFANPAAERILGVEPGGLKGRSLKEFLDQAGWEKVQAETRARARGEKGTYELEITRPDGEKRVLLVTAVPRFDGSGLFSGSLGVFRDSTEWKRMEERLRKEEQLAALGHMAAGIAHDFRSRLTAIRLYAEMGLMGGELPPRLAANLNTVLDETQEMSDLVQKIVDFSSRSMLHRQRLDLAAVTEETLTALRPQLPADVRFTVERGSGPYVVLADEGRIRQVIVNLALNARDAMPDGGELRIELSQLDIAPSEWGPTVDQGPGDAASSKKQPYVRLTIADSGMGMTEEVRKRLFEPFFTTKEVGEGSGLGLPQAYGIVSQHGGTMEVVSAPGAGATFHIYLPVCREAGDETRTVASGAAQREQAARNLGMARSQRAPEGGEGGAGPSGWCGGPSP